MSDYSVYDIEYKSPYEDEIIFDGENISIINNSHYKKAAINKYLKIISEENQQDIINNISMPLELTNIICEYSGNSKLKKAVKKNINMSHKPKNQIQLSDIILLAIKKHGR